jgi:hypothetical protein|eukprot:COSAG06_NODE_482_length_15147_cov_9.932815_17_plen_42_part_00
MTGDNAYIWFVDQIANILKELGALTFNSSSSRQQTGSKQQP